MESKLTLSATECAALVGVSRITWFRHHQTGKTPRPNRLGKLLMWDRAEILRWYEAGMPSRKIWEAMGKGVRNECL
jgi:predicted DNA-binding transcriptional regulator AlpA